jgi:hypothetical protein
MPYRSANLPVRETVALAVKLWSLCFIEEVLNAELTTINSTAQHKNFQVRKRER